jgi:glycosyltransferase involved in cell wall biosynthesis
MFAHRWRAARRLLAAEGPVALVRAARAAWKRDREAALARYAEWAAEHSSPDAEALARRLAALAHRPLVSVVMPVFDPPATALRAAIESVLAQAYPDWELSIADDGSSNAEVRALLEAFRARDPRIHVARRAARGGISAATNTALEAARGEYVAFLDHDDRLAPEALLAVAEELAAHPDAALVYSDEDKLDFTGARTHPNFKPDWNEDLFLSHNIAAHLAVYRTDLVRALGGLREGFEGAQDYDLALRVLERAGASRIRHIPRVLYHWRMVPGSTALTAFEKGDAAERARRAIEEHLARRGIAAKVETLAGLGAQRVRYPLPAGARVDVLRMNDRNNGALGRNDAARGSKADVLVFVGPGVAPASQDAIDELAAQALRADIGAVGGVLRDRRGAIVHGGTILGAGHANRGRLRGEAGYMMRAALVQSLSALPGDCFAVSRALFESAGGFDAAFDRAFHDIDFCLRVARDGRRNLYTPFAGFRAEADAILLPACDAASLARFPAEAALLRERWGDVLAADPAYNPNLSLAAPFALARPPR